MRSPLVPWRSVSLMEPFVVGVHLIRQGWPARMDSEPSGLLMGFWVLCAASTVEAKAATHKAAAVAKKRILIDVLLGWF